MKLLTGILLKERDVIYGVELKSGKLTDPITIDVCSANFAISICGKYKFNRKITTNGEAIKITDVKDFSNYKYYIETPQIIESHKRQMLIYDILNFNYNNLSTSWLQEIKDSLKRKPIKQD